MPVKREKWLVTVKITGSGTEITGIFESVGLRAQYSKLLRRLPFRIPDDKAGRHDHELSVTRVKYCDGEKKSTSRLKESPHFRPSRVHLSILDIFTDFIKMKL
ncbi:hypothetical protein AVEN_30521-1 [Araneus ventricosus]|uniref:Uncharacterized protein n=1 Tax=Araneus ventricosus TaxID=182803 RepID=A0A4Y2J9V5_ARAVE|nr:hypothetical protein AVEN_30521-1 [Araneus ventricosus]